MKSAFSFKVLMTTLIIATIAVACGNGSYDKRLTTIDSMLNAKDFEAALSSVKAIDASTLSNKDKAYFALLKSQTDYKNYITATTDSAINFAVYYFSKSSDKEKYTRSLIYQGCVNEELGNLEKAVECYHKADDVADEKDLANKAFAKMRLGLLYQNQHLGAKTIALEKLKEALPLYQTLNDKHYELICITEIGRLYSSKPNMKDSALYFIDLGINNAKNELDEYMEFSNLYIKSLLYSEIEHDYKKAKDILIDTKRLGQVSNTPGVYHNLAFCYAKLGEVDSAEFYLRNSPSMNDYVDSITYFDTASEIEKVKHNDDLSRMYFDKSRTIADSILIHSLNHRLLAVEKKYDTQQVELENAKLSSKLRGTLLTVAALVIVALLLGLLMMRYRQRLRNKEHEYELLKSELDASLASLRNVHDELGKHERIDESSEHSKELKGIIDEQIKNVQQLMQWSYELDSDTFIRKFNTLMRMPDEKSDEDSSYWSNIHQIANELHNNVLVRAQEATGGTLRNDELNYLALYSCGFTRTVIMLCMGYKSLGTVSNKKLQIAHKLNVSNLDDFLKQENPSQPL